MIMLFKLVRAFKLGAIVTKLVFGDQVAVEQEFYRVVQCSTAYPVFVVFHADVQGFDIKMAIRIIDLFKDGKPLGRLPVPALFQVVCEDFLYSFE
jgi:hypothetical protein